MKIKLLITLTAASIFTAACGENVESAANKATEQVKTAVTQTIKESTDSAKASLDATTEAVKNASPLEKAADAVTKVKESSVAAAKPTIQKEETKVAQTATTVEKATNVTATKYAAGQHYDVLTVPIEVSSDKVQVTELFWYGCGHCFQLEPHMQKFRANLPTGSEFVEIPAVFGNQWKFHAQTFYTAQALGIQEETHQEIFDTIHLKKKRLSTLAQLQDLFAKHGKDKKAVESAFNSFSVDSNLRNATIFARKAGVSSVPTIIIDGKYKTSVSRAGGYDQLLDLMRHLVEKSKAERS